MRRATCTIFLSFVALVIVTASCGGPARRGASPASESVSSRLPLLGQRAPDFTLPSASGGSVTLSTFKGDRPVLLYFSMGPG